MHSDDPNLIPASPSTATRDERLGHEISYGVQQTLACWATDFIDPPVSRFLQNKFGDKNHEVTHAHVWGGEIIGDSSALFSYLFIKRMFTKPVDALISAVKSKLDPYFTKMGDKSLDSVVTSY